MCNIDFFFLAKFFFFYRDLFHSRLLKFESLAKLVKSGKFHEKKMMIPSFKRTRFWLNLALWFFGNVFPIEGDLGNVNKCSIIEQTAAKIALT